MKKRIYLCILLPLIVIGCLAGYKLIPALWNETAVNVGELRENNSSGEVAESAEITQASDLEMIPQEEVIPEHEPVPEPEPVFEEWDITLMAVGDNLMHMGIVNTGKQKDGSYEYAFLFEGISDFLDVADIRIINQETILGGNELGFSGYPRFNSPTEVGDAIAERFNVVLQASNHSADKGIDGLQHCVSFWEGHPEVLMTGIYAESADSHEIPLLTIDGVNFAVLNYTYSPNSQVIPKDVRGHLDILCNWNRETGSINFTSIDPQVLEDIKRAKELADVVIVCPHWGTEYATTPSKYQKEFALQMTEAGADLIIGTHPHVVQPVEWVESENGNKALCYYSLGNYVSTQKGGPSMLEAMAWVTFRVKEDGVVISEENTGVFPMVCQYKSGPVRFENVYLLEEYTPELAGRHGIRNYGGVNLTVEDLQQWSDEILGEWVLPISDVVGSDQDTQEEQVDEETATTEDGGEDD